jgi:hypothetical protein
MDDDSIGFVVGSVIALRTAVATILTIAVLLVGDSGSTRAQPASTSLSPGWNNVLYTGAPGAIATVLAPLAGNLSAVLIWDALGQRWHAYYPGNVQASDLQSIVPGQVYWIAVQSAASLPAGIGTPSPVQIVSGWNNVAYIGPGSAGSSTLEQTSVWTWDAPSQHWLFRDPEHPQASDFQSLTPLRSYWIDLPGASGQPAASAPPSAPSISGSCFAFTSTQPSVADIEDAITRGGNANLHGDPALELPAEHSGPDASGTVQPGYVPPIVLRGIAWAESSWHQSSYDTPRGRSGPTLVSSGCAYGLMQMASGMSITSSPTNTQQLIGTDFRANVEAGAQLLAKNWNSDASTIPIYGRHDPHVIEDWYFAIWAYHCFGDSCSSYGAHDDPDDPSLPWPRPAYNSQQQSASTSLSASDYPYEELIFGLIGNPPLVDGHQEWQPISLELPPHGAVGFPKPHSVGEASAHLDSGATLAASSPLPASSVSLVPPGAPQVISPGVAALPGSR